MLFSHERVKLKIILSKLALTVPGESAIFPGKRKTINYPVKISVNGTQGTMLFSRERERL